jgi:cytochrome c
VADADDADRYSDRAAMSGRSAMRPIALGAAVLAGIVVSNGISNVEAGLKARLLQTAAKRTTDGVYTVDQAKRGRDVYRKRCVLCHLDNGQGREAEPFIPGQSLEREGDAEAPPVAGDAFLKKWNGHTARELYDKLAATMPVGGAGSLTPQEYTDVLAHLFELNKLPAGQQELPALRDQLDPIIIGR